MNNNGGETMSAIEAARLRAWMKQHGHTDAEAWDLLEAIAYGERLHKGLKTADNRKAAPEAPGTAEDAET